jgi:hypothetical protein
LKDILLSSFHVLNKNIIDIDQLVRSIDHRKFVKFKHIFLIDIKSSNILKLTLFDPKNAIFILLFPSSKSLINILQN